MKLDIMLSERSGMDCFSGLIAKVMEFFKKDYRLSFIDSWDFQYMYNSPANFWLLYTPQTMNHNVLQKYCGIQFVKDNFSDKNSFMTMLKNELQEGRPVLVIVDFFYCPWNTDFKSYHKTDHATLIVGYDDDNLICMDYSPRVEECKLSYEVMDKALLEYYTFDTNHFAEEVDIPSFLNLSIDSIKSKRIMKNLRRFGDFIEERFDPAVDLGYMSPEDTFTPKMWELHLLSNGRILYSQALKSLQERYEFDYLSPIIEKLESTKSNWSIVETLLSRLYLTDDADIKARIKKAVYSLVETEESIIHDYEDILRTICKEG